MRCGKPRLGSGLHRAEVNAFTITEVLIALLIAVILVIGIIELLGFNFLYQNQQELRANAMSVLALEMEKVKKQFIFKIEPYMVTVTDNRTPDNPNDDTTATLTVSLFKRPFESGHQLSQAPQGDDCIKVVMKVTWRGRGRLSSRLYSESLVGYLIP